MLRWRMSVGGIAVAVAATGVLVVSSAASATPECPVSANNAKTAVAQARMCGGQVEDLSRRTGTGRLLANPDGSWVSEESATPRFVRGSDGAWRDVDPTIVVAGDGSLSPRAAAFPMTFSGGGESDPLATVSRRNRTVSLRWPGSLPAPVVNGSEITYPDVFPDVDLHVAVSVDGFSEVLVVKTRQAASQPALHRLVFGFSAQGLSVTDDDGVSISDSSGPVFRSGAPVMWDSASGVSNAGAGDGRAAGDKATSDVHGPAPAAHRAVMGTVVSDGSLTVTPDASMLDGLATVFPVFIDPSIGLTSWTMINSTFPNQSYWSYDRNDCPSAFNNHQCAKVGYTTEAQAMVYRSLFQFPTSSYVGRHVLDATFSLTLLHSWQCSNSETDLHSVSGQLGSGTTWNSNASHWGGTLASVSNQNCHDASNVYTGFHNSGSGGLTSVVATAASQSAGYTTFGLRAANESGVSGWKKFDAATATLAVTFNSYPNTPDKLSIDNVACGTGDDKAYVSTIGGHNPVLRARLSDPDAANHLTGTFTWSTNAGTTTGSQSNIANGQVAQVTTVGSAFTSGVTYSYSVSASDGTDSSHNSGGPCEFVVDNTAPSQAPTVTSADGRYPADDGSGALHDGVGKAGSFTFGANGVSDVVGYLYSLGTSPPTVRVNVAGAGGSATVSLTPLDMGVNDLYVRGVDRVGNLGPITDYRFYVATGAAPVAWWRFDDASGSTAQDTGSGGTPLSLTSGTGWSPGRIAGNSAGSFNGSTGYGATTGPVINSSASLSISAWVRLTDASDYRMAVSLAGVHDSSFFLYYDHGSNRWGFQSRDSDVGTSVGPYALSSQPPTLGVWTHLAGVYDTTAGEMRLYVNGVLVATVARTAMWNATGAVQIGRFYQSDAYSSYWQGDLADVRIYDRVVTSTEIADMAAPVLVGKWDLDEGGGSQAYDGSGHNHTGTLTSGASFAFTGHNAASFGSATFNGVDGAITTAGPVLHTDQSYTIAAWVRVNPGTDDGYYSVLSQDDAEYPGFQLEYIQDDGCVCWGLLTPGGHADDPTQYQVTASAQTNTWTHLVGVYDASTHTALLYVNGQLEDSLVVPAVSWSASGPFTIGRTWWAGATSDWWPGDIDNVRVYQGALSAAQIVTLANE